MLSNTLKRSVATVGVVAGLLAAAVPAIAAVPGTGNAGQPNNALPTAAGATSQGIIMSDGRICDPIRHMGC